MSGHFTPEELAGLDPTFVHTLEMARVYAGVPFVITSGFRSPDKNKGLSGAVGDSSHLTGHAVDLHIADHHTFERILAGLLDAGFNRLGLYFAIEGTTLVPKHIHVDDDKTKPPEVVWSLIEQN